MDRLLGVSGVHPAAVVDDPAEDVLPHAAPAEGVDGDQAIAERARPDRVAHEGAAVPAGRFFEHCVGPAVVGALADSRPVDSHVGTVQDDAALRIVVAHHQEGLQVLIAADVPTAQEADQPLELGPQAVVPVAPDGAELHGEVGRDHLGEQAGDDRVLDDDALCDRCAGAPVDHRGDARTCR